MKKKVILKIDGMSCIACKEKIENAVTKMTGVLSVNVKLEKNIADIEYDPDEIPLFKIRNEIEDIGYNIIGFIDEKSDKENDLIQIFSIIVIAIGAYILINKTIGFNFIPEITNEMGFLMLFVVGLFTSLHCVSMCGGINLSQCIPKKEGDKRALPSIIKRVSR